MSRFYGFLALPVTFKRELQNEVSKGGGTAMFSCELSKPGAPVDWRKGRIILKSQDKYEIKQDGKIATLIIHNIEESDAGYYSCKTKDSESTAELTVQGKERRFSVGGAIDLAQLTFYGFCFACCGEVLVNLHINLLFVL